MYITAFHEGVRLKLLGNYEEAVARFKICLKELLNNNDDVIIFKFTATWCAPCKRASPVINNYKNMNII